MVGFTKESRREIVYNNIDHFAVIVAEGEYRGIKYVCVNRGTCPCAYVFLPSEFIDSHISDEYTIPGIQVHGGIDYIGNANELLALEDYDGICIGWDYDHNGDWTGHLSDEENREYGHHKYTTKILVGDCEKVIDQYYKILEDEQQEYDDDSQLTGRFLVENGFKTLFSNGDEDVFQISGDEMGGRWKIYIDLKKQEKSFVISQSPRRKYEGPILTIKNLKRIIRFFNLPISLK